MYSLSFNLCLSLLFALPIPSKFDSGASYDECVDLIDRTHETNLPPALVASLAYSESWIRPDARSYANARGSLQVLPHIHCKPYRACYLRTGSRKRCDQHINECDFKELGLKALIAFLRPHTSKWNYWNRQTLWTQHKRLEGYKRQDLVNGLCGYTGCSVDRPKEPDYTHDLRLDFVNDILHRAEWIQNFLDCECSLPFKERGKKG